MLVNYPLQYLVLSISEVLHKDQQIRSKNSIKFVSVVHEISKAKRKEIILMCVLGLRGLEHVQDTLKINSDLKVRYALLQHLTSLQDCK